MALFLLALGGQSESSGENREQWRPRSLSRGGGRLTRRDSSRRQELDESHTEEWLVPEAGDLSEAEQRRQQAEGLPKRRFAPTGERSQELDDREVGGGGASEGGRHLRMVLEQKLAAMQERAETAERRAGEAESRATEAEKRAEEAAERARVAEARADNAVKGEQELRTGLEPELAAIKQNLEAAERRAQESGKLAVEAEQRADQAAERARIAESQAEEAIGLEQRVRTQAAQDFAATEKRAAEAERRADEAEARIEVAERRTGPAQERAEGTARRSQKERRRPARGPAQPRPSNGHQLDINAVGFEDLRGLGLSVTESARVIAIRDVRNGFDSLKELDDLADLSKDVVSKLKRHVRV